MNNQSVSINPVAVPSIMEKFKSPKMVFTMLGIVCFFCLPIFQPSYFIIDLATKVLIFGILAASYDILLGYTGIVSFAHSMFFGFGAYSCALFFEKMPESPLTALLLATVCSLVISAVVAAVMALFSLRVEEIFFAMITLAFATFTEILAIEFSEITGGEDGITIQLPAYFEVSHQSILGFTGQTWLYYFIFGACLIMFFMCLRFTESPVGRVLKSILGNEKRSEALGYRTFHYKLLTTVFSCVLAGFCGILFALWISYASPESSLGIAITLNVLIMVLIGGIGTIYGGLIGAFVLQLFESGLPQFKILSDKLFPNVPVLGNITERWLLMFGLLYVIIVLFFPKGVLGALRGLRQNKTP